MCQFENLKIIKLEKVIFDKKIYLMKHFYYSITILIILLTACSSEDNTNTPVVNDKQLKLTFNDNTQNLNGLSISLFESESDFLNNVVLETQDTDSNGSVTFENLGSNKYYWKVETSCIDNLSQNNSINNLSNQLTVFNITADNNRTGTITINNNSSYTYSYIANINSNSPVYGENFPLAMNMLPNSSETFFNIAVGSVVFQFIKQDGSNTTYQFNEEIMCEQTTTIDLN